MKYKLKSGEQFIVDGYTSEGEHKVLNLLDTNTDDIATLKVVSHTKLQYLKNTEQLSPGTFYRIIDYKCTTTQENTQVGQGRFDLVVQALSESELSEKGRCIRHSGNSYFSNCKVESWEVNYSLDNNKSKYSWVDDEVIAICCDDGDDVNSWYKRRPELDESKNGTQYYAWDCIWNNEEDDYWMLRDVDKDDTFNIDSENNYRNDCIYTTVNNPEQGQSIQQYYKSGSNFYLDGNYSYHIIQKGHGVIYWMKDEFGNECPYDFKHLKFLDSSNNDYAWTFNNDSNTGGMDDNPNNLPTKTIIDAEIWVNNYLDNGDWIDDLGFSQQELADDYTLDTTNYKIYNYTGNSINYNGDTLYIWRLSGKSLDYVSPNDRGGYAYLFTTDVDYSDVTVADHVEPYAFGMSEDTGDIYKLETAYNDPNWIFHGIYSEEVVPDPTALINNLSQVDAHLYIDNFIDEEGNWGVDENVEGPEDLENAQYSEEYTFTGNYVEYEGKILFLWTEDNFEGTIFTTGLDYTGYDATDQIFPVFATGNTEGAVAYQKDGRLHKNLNSIVVGAEYSGPSIPKGNLYTISIEDSSAISQNLSSSIQYNIIPIKYNELGAQILDLTQIYYGPRKGYPYSKDEIDEAHKVIATALNEQKEILDKTIPFPEIVEVEHQVTPAYIVIEDNIYFRNPTGDLTQEVGEYPSPYSWKKEGSELIYTPSETPSVSSLAYYDGAQSESAGEISSYVPANDGTEIIQELDPWKYYIFGEVNSLEVSFSEEVSEYTPIYRFLFTAASSSTRLILPQDCSLASGHSLVMAEGKSYEITVINNIVRVISATLE